MRLIPAFFSVCFFCLSVCGAADGFEFRINGTAFKPAAIYLQHQDKFHEGDLISVGNALMVLGPPGLYDFKTISHDDGRLLRVMKDGSEVIAAFHIRLSYKDKKENYRIFNSLSDKELSSLSGIFIESWSEGISEKLKHINPEKTCLVIASNAATDGKIPPVPSEIQYLYIVENSSFAFEDFSYIANFHNLKFFHINLFGKTPFNINLLSGSKNIETFGMSIYPTAKAVNIETLSIFKNLRNLSLKNCDGINDISFVNSLGKLRSLDISGSPIKNIAACSALPELEYIDVSMTGVSDLTPLSSSKHLKTIKANISRVSRLPMVAFPELSEVWLFSTMLSDSEVDSFAALNPECRKIYFRYNEALQKAVDGADTVKVRVMAAGGIDAVIYELKTPREIKDLVDNMKVTEPPKNKVFRCACLGNPHFDFYKDGNFVTTVSLHHGISLRWNWVSDAKLENNSAEYLCDFLAKHGWIDAREEREKEKKNSAALERRIRIYEKYFPAESLGILRNIMNVDAVKKELAKLPGTTVEKAILFFKVFDCDDCSWNLQAGFDNTISSVILPSFDEKTLIDAVKSLNGKNGINGAARWFFFNGERTCLKYDKNSLNSIIPALAEAGLSHPRKINRAITIYALSSIGGTVADEWLVKCFNEEIKVRKADPENLIEPGGLMTSTAATFFPENASDWALAADALLRSGNKSILPALRKKINNASDEDKKLLSKHLK